MGEAMIPGLGYRKTELFALILMWVGSHGCTAPLLIGGLGWKGAVLLVLANVVVFILVTRVENRINKEERK